MDWYVAPYYRGSMFQRWAEAVVGAVQALLAAFQNTRQENWPICDLLLPHVTALQIRSPDESRS